MTEKKEDAESHRERLAAEQAVRNAVGGPISVNRNAPTHEQNAGAEDGWARVVDTNKGRYTVLNDGKVEKGGKIIR
jgi:hypothetical protein